MQTNAEITDMVQLSTHWGADGKPQHGIEVGFDTRDDGREILFVKGGLTSPQLTTSTRPRAKGAMHDKATLDGQAVCTAAGLDFWAVSGTGPRTYWATSGQDFYLVHHDRRAGRVDWTWVDAWGRSLAETFSDPAPTLP